MLSVRLPVSMQCTKHPPNIGDCGRLVARAPERRQAVPENNESEDYADDDEERKEQSKHGAAPRPLPLVGRTVVITRFVVGVGEDGAEDT